MSDIEKLRRKHQKEIQELQERCTHEKSEWRPYAWAPGHYWGEVRICLNCGKILERSEPKLIEEDENFGGMEFITSSGSEL